MTAAALDGPHWRFAVRLYGLPGVADACLLLQDRLGVDVNILLLAAYAAAERGIALEAGDVRDMDSAVASWRSAIVAELRKLRRRLKSGPEPAPCGVTERLRSEIQSAELHAEQIEQAVLAGWLERRAFGRPRSDVDIGRALHTVVTHFANVNGAAAGDGEVHAAEQALVTATTRIRSVGTDPASPAPSRGID
jgi:uncharacterized protein (TIGR02444 family)